MPSFKAHCAISRHRTGFDFAKLHDWIYNPPESEFLGSDHRIERHAYINKDMKYLKNYWD